MSIENIDSLSSTISICTQNKIEFIIKYNGDKWKLTLFKILDGIKITLSSFKNNFSYENIYDNYDLNKFPIFNNLHDLIDYAKIIASSINNQNFKIEENIESINLIILEHDIHFKLYIKNIIRDLLIKIDELKFEINQIKEKIKFNEINDTEIKDNKPPLNEIITQKKKNTIKATYLIEDNDKNKDIKIIDKKFEKDCEIDLNNQQINTRYTFKEKGEYTITFNFKKELEDISYLFYYYSQLIEIDLSNFKTQNVKSMKCLFSTCRQLKKINLKNINTNEVTDMKDMFSNCNDLEELDLSSFQTQNVKTMENMFYYCTSLKKLNVKNFDIRNVTTMKNMFSHCENLTDLDLSNFINENVEDISFMFSNCKNLKKLDFSKFEYHQKMKKNGIFNDIEGNLKYFLINFKP